MSSRERLNRRMMVRLVKGAYWDTEIKRAQERGLDDYPVFTRKAMTDLNYVACARTIAGAAAADLSAIRHPQRADGRDHARTAPTAKAASNSSACMAWAKRSTRNSAKIARTSPVAPMRRSAATAICSPIWCGGCLENGANSSFVALAADETVPVTTLLRRPADDHRQRGQRRGIPTSRCRAISTGRSGRIRAASNSASARRSDQLVVRPSPRKPLRRSTEQQSPMRHRRKRTTAISPRTRRDSKNWSRTPADIRARDLEKAADLLEQRAAHFIALLQREGGKTLDDALSEVREAVDFCRYYAARGPRSVRRGEAMPGPTGESNVLRLRGRGVFIAISPWNFPLAIFLGQVTAALMAGNAVVAKPAEQTPLIAAEAVRLLHEAGVPASALHLVQGDGRIGAALVAHPDIAGVVFTGSTEVARSINRTLAAKDGPIVPLIAETGGINAMIVDATALPEQVADDVVTSAFRSAGQRCSALRLLFLQDDVADRMIEMIAGAARELAIGDPADPATHIGPVIDAEAKQRLDAHIARMKTRGAGAFRGHRARTAIMSRRIFSNCPMPAN